MKKNTMTDRGNLVKDGSDPSDYRLREGADSVWITVDGIDVHLRKAGGGVVVDLFPTCECEEPLSTAWLAFEFNSQGE
ncbi:MAG: hypothetical protein RBS68_15580 [Anaerolineales bacterium]|jgi:hypothetical protein|nr:hypothetical protein [Anaerolineales bacterium]